MELIRYELDNGMTVLLHPTATAPVVACNVWVGVGSADEEPAEAGLAHVHEHMLFKGTERRAVGEIAREVEAAGGHINAFTSFDQTCYYVVMSSRYFSTGLDILSDAIRRSSFDADELERELEVIQEEIKRGNDSPSRVASLKLFETAYAEHPYRLPVIGTSESVDSFGRDDVVNFYHKHYVPSNMALVLAGDFDVDEAKQLVEEYFGDFTGTDHAAVDRVPEPEQSGFRGWTGTDELNETQLRMGFHVPHATHDDIPALDLLGAIMGYGDASHLYQTIQREQQLVNSIYAGAYTPKDAGLFMVSAQYQLESAGGGEAAGTKSHPDIVRAILEEVFRFRDARVGDAEIARARTIIESQEIYGKQTVQGLAMKIGHYQMVTGDPGYEQEYYARLAEVTAEDIQRVARAYLTPANCSAVLLHPDSEEAVGVDALAGAVDEAFAVSQLEAVTPGHEPDEEGFVRVELTDGPTLIVQEDPSVETFSVRALTLGGLRFETEENNGINSLLAELITQGTANRTAVEIAREVEAMAGSISGLGGRNSFGVSMSGLSRFFERSFEIFADCVLGATIPDAEFEREQRLQIQNIRARQDQLGAVNYDRFTTAFFSPHPYAMPSDGTEASVAALSPQQLRDYLDRLVSPQNLVLVVVGDVDADHVAQLCERYFVRPEAQPAFRPDIPQVAAHDAPKLVVGDLDKNQAHVIVGFEAPGLDDEARYALDVVYAVLSGQGGRLFYELRDKQSLAYSVYARTIYGLDGSAFTINIGTSPEKIEQALGGMVDQVRQLRAGGITDEELARAKRYLIGSHDIGLQKNSARSMKAGLDELYGLGYKRSLEFGERIEAVTVDDVQAVVDRYLVPERMVAAVTKPGDLELPDDLLERVLG